MSQTNNTDITALVRSIQPIAQTCRTQSLSSGELILQSRAVSSIYLAQRFSYRALIGARNHPRISVILRK